MKKPLNRRNFLAGALGLGAWAALAPRAWAVDVNVNVLKKKPAAFPYALSDAEWRARLSPEAYHVLREGEREPAGSSPLFTERRKGVYHCAGCGAPLFSWRAKFGDQDCGGWPAFKAPLDRRALGTSTDFKIILPRTAVHCANCGGHLGHVFLDGPAPDGKRYCLNGAALDFHRQS